jgi:hypothetical protein
LRGIATRLKTHGAFLFSTGITGYPDMLALPFSHPELAVDLTIGVVSRSRLDLPVVSLHGQSHPAWLTSESLLLSAATGGGYRGGDIWWGDMNMNTEEE